MVQAWRLTSASEDMMIAWQSRIFSALYLSGRLCALKKANMREREMSPLLKEALRREERDNSNLEAFFICMFVIGCYLLAEFLGQVFA